MSFIYHINVSQATTIQLYWFCGFLCVLLWFIFKECYGCAAPRWGSVSACWVSRFLWLEVADLCFFCNAIPCSPLKQTSGASFPAKFQQLCFCAWLVRFLICTTLAVICRTHGAANVSDFPGIDADTRRPLVRLLPFHSERTFVRCFLTSLPNGGQEHRKRIRVFV